MSKRRKSAAQATRPPSARREPVRERRAGIDLLDPYRWMESPSAELERWVNGQDRHTRGVLDRAPQRARLDVRFERLLGAGSIGVPSPRGQRLFYHRRRPGAERAALCAREGPDGAERVLLDPASLSPPGGVSLGSAFISPDGTRAVCQLIERSTSRGALRVLDLATATLLDDAVPADLYPLAQTRPGVNTAQWSPAGDGFYYTRHGAEAGAEPRYGQWLHYHRMGDDWRDDELLFGPALAKEQTPYPRLSEDGRWLALEVVDLSGDRPVADVYLCDLNDPNRRFAPVLVGLGALFGVGWHRGSLYLKTNLDAPFGRILRVEPERAGQGMDAFETVIGESGAVVGGWAAIADSLFVELIDNAASRLCAFDLGGRAVGEVTLPARGRLGALEAEPEGEGLWFSFSSFLVPDTVYHADLHSLRAEPWMASPARFDRDAFELDQVWYESADRTRVPMFVVHRKGLARDGRRPTVVGGYGGFNEIKSPAYDPGIIPLLEAGGVYALASVRGGGEFGDAWHRAGMRGQKQNTFDDFIAAAEWLVEAGYTSPQRLGCIGWSNGGLLVNAVALKRPGLWRAVVAGAPVTDLARFHLAGGRHWLAEYGAPDNPDDLRSLLEISPYHALPEEIEAPALLLWVPAEDDRVAPWHGYKMLARWQAANRSGRPVLLRAERGAGHRGCTMASGTIARYADIWTFFFSELGVA